MLCLFITVKTKNKNKSLSLLRQGKKQIARDKNKIEVGPVVECFEKRVECEEKSSLALCSVKSYRRKHNVALRIHRLVHGEFLAPDAFPAVHIGKRGRQVI